MRIFCRVEYNGTAYAGWQIQDDQKSVQGTIELALTTILRTKTAVVGAGRTDAGVHARGQGMHFDCADDVDLSKLSYSVNSILPPDIALYQFEKVAPEFHARFSAIERRYRYTMTSRKMPLMPKLASRFTYLLDWDLMQREANTLLGKHDFSAFCASRTTTTNMVCSVTKAEFTREGELVVFTISADRFIYKMVRSVVGTLVDIGRGSLQVTIADIIAGKSRATVGETAPPWGLVLDYVAYREVD